MTALRFDPPSLPTDALASIARDRFGIEGSLVPLRGERDQNTLIRSARSVYVLKLASPSEDPATVDLQCRALLHVAATDPTLPVPRLVPTRDGEYSAEIDLGSAVSRARMLTYLPGATFDDAGVMSLDGLRGVGAFQARLTLALGGFEHPAASNFMPWALDSGVLGDDRRWDDLAADSRALLEPCRPRIRAATAGLAGLRRQVMHNDGHRGNLLRAAPGTEVVCGVIDFGDLVDTALAAELGISGASFLGGLPDPVAGLCSLAGGFHERLPLTAAEVELLPELVLCRLALSTLLVDYQIANAPHIAGSVAAERPDLLRRLAAWSVLDPSATGERLAVALR